MVRFNLGTFHALRVRFGVHCAKLTVTPIHDWSFSKQLGCDLTTSAEF
jgi:hypothetical protein